MGRRSVRAERRRELVEAFSRVLARQGYAGATVAAVAAEAGLAPGLIHHHFGAKEELLEALLEQLLLRFRRGVARRAAGTDALEAWLDAALALDSGADVVAARCWVGLLAEAVRDPGLFQRVRRLIDAELERLVARSDGALRAPDAGALLAFVAGSLVLGAFAPRKTSGFAAPAARRLLEGLRRGAPARGHAPPGR